eukprot:3384530-Pyramimonas_sp.AAC.1
MATKLPWGPAGGLIVYSIYLYVGEGMSVHNVALLKQLAEHVMLMRSMGHTNWLCGGDFNNSPED